MSDPIANFPLRAASKDELSTALGRCYADYNAWHGQANFIADFAQDARIAGVESVVAKRIGQLLDFAEAEGLIVTTATKTKSNQEISNELASHQLITADLGVKIAAIVMLHNACEQFLWRLVRFGLVVNREQVLKWIEGRKVTVQKLAGQEIDILIDEHIEKWWDELERDSLMKKWERLVGLFGLPDKLRDESWHFDRDMLSRFDDVRHNAVHHDGKLVREFDFTEFAKQLWRAQLVWLVHVGLRLRLKIPVESLFAPI